MNVSQFSRSVCYEVTSESLAALDAWQKAAARRRWYLNHRIDRVIRKSFALRGVVRSPDTPDPKGSRPSNGNDNTHLIS